MDSKSANRLPGSRNTHDALSLLALFCYDDEVLLGTSSNGRTHASGACIGGRIPASQFHREIPGAHTFFDPAVPAPGPTACNNQKHADVAARQLRRSPADQGRGTGI